MRIRVLGSDGGVSPGKKTTSFLVNDKILIDAGSPASSLSISKQEQIDKIIISHPHIDHIKDIPFIADNVIGYRKKPIEIISIAPVIEDIKNHLFNNVLWPDMSKIPAGNPVLVYRPVKEEIEIDGLTIKMYKVNHPGNAVGFILSDDQSSVVITGDTGPTDHLWEKANERNNLKAIFTEVAFPNEQENIANLSGHFTPNTLTAELKKINGDIPLYIYHFKPRYYELLHKQMQESSITNYRVIETEDEFVF